MKIIATLLCAALVLALIPVQTSAQVTHGTIPADLSAHDLVARMGTGWNLGNTFDAQSGNQVGFGWLGGGVYANTSVELLETAWLGGPAHATTQSLIQAISALGFDTLRIPTTWHKAADPDNNWQLRADWLERVQEVVDWAMEENMFVILNTHHENGVIYLGVEGADDPEHPGNIFIRYIWHQIAEHFRDYDERLIFASLNEPRQYGGPDEWSGGTQTVRDNVNHLNQLFVDVVRATGGNNVYRILQVPTVAAGATTPGMRDFIVPYDPMNTVNKIVWSIHTYSPFAWAHDGRGTYHNPQSVADALSNVAMVANALGIPVILGEWGSISASVGDNADQELRDRERPIHAEDYIREATNNGMVAVWWDNGGFGAGGHSFGIVPRGYPHAVSDTNMEVIDGIMRGLLAATTPDEPEPYEASEPEPEPEISPEPQPEDAPPDETYDDDNGGLAWWLWLAIGGGALAALGICVAVLRRKK
jgi:endoglucanase